jgi:hypothetical protein
MKCGSIPSLSHYTESRVRAAGPRRAEWRAVVAPDRPRQAVTLEGAFKKRPAPFDCLRRNARVEQKTGMAVGDRLRIDAPLIARAEPAFEIGRPLLVGRPRRNHNARRIKRRPSAPGLLHEARSLENVADRRSRRPIRSPIASLKHPKKFARPQVGKPTPRRDDRLFDRRNRAMRAGARCMRAIAKPVLIPAAQLRYGPTPKIVVRQHLNSLFHATGLSKRHRKSPFRACLTCRPSTWSKVSGIYPVHTIRTALPSPPLGRNAHACVVVEVDDLAFEPKTGAGVGEVSPCNPSLQGRAFGEPLVEPGEGILGGGELTQLATVAAGRGAQGLVSTRREFRRGRCSARSTAGERSAPPPSMATAGTQSSRRARPWPGSTQRTIRPRPALRLPHRGRPPRRAAGHAPIAPSLGAAGRGLLQRGGDRTRPLGAARLTLSTPRCRLLSGATIEGTVVESCRGALAERPNGAGRDFAHPALSHGASWRDSREDRRSADRWPKAARNRP